jgi:hypothetical protein
LDGYFLLRYLRIAVIICFLGCCITWPILFPVNATGGNHSQQLNIIAFGNIAKNKQNRYYGKAFWVRPDSQLLTIFSTRIRFLDFHRACVLHGHQGEHLLHQRAERIPAIALLCQTHLFKDSALHFGSGRICQRSQDASAFRKQVEEHLDFD